MKITASLLALAAHSALAAPPPPPSSSVYNIYGSVFNNETGSEKTTWQLICHTYKRSPADFTNAQTMFQDNFHIFCDPTSGGTPNPCYHLANLSPDDLDRISKWFQTSRWGWCTSPPRQQVAARHQSTS